MPLNHQRISSILLYPPSLSDATSYLSLHFQSTISSSSHQKSSTNSISNHTHYRRRDILRINNGWRQRKIWRQVIRWKGWGRWKQETTKPLEQSWSSVPLWSCQAFLEEQHPKQDARRSQGCCLRYRCSRVSDCRSSRACRKCRQRSEGQAYYPSSLATCDSRRRRT
ncbi:hypothetical protein PVAG01_01382 [Phlyctema vagabunda]|uniref:Uncharacterized protein n=1 Tax=Phlyctema vagabunda TaxID=108571 RepID=A0ABR4PWY3_9HELO